MYTFATATATATATITYLEKSFGIGPVVRLSWQPATTKSFWATAVVRITSIKSACFFLDVFFFFFALSVFLLLTKRKSKQTLDITLTLSQLPQRTALQPCHRCQLSLSTGLSKYILASMNHLHT